MSKSHNRPGIVLIAVLAAVVLLSLAAYQYSELMIGEYQAADSAIRAAQARSIAVSGVHYAAAALSDTTTVANVLNNNLHDNESAFRGIEVQPDDRPRFAGRFSLVAPPAVDDALNGSTNSRFGVIDEGSKINLNALVALDSTGTVAHNVLIKLPNMTEEIVDAIIDWIDADDEQRPSGAENQYYSGLSPGYRCKNGPLDTLEELLLVRGVTPQLLFGTDKNRNGRADTNEDDGNGFDPGWSAYLTVYSREINRDIDHQTRIYLNDRDINSLYDKLNTAVGEELATWIVAYRLYGGGSTSTSGSASASAGGQLSKNMLDFNRRASSVSSIFSLVDGVVSIPQQGGGSSGGATITATATINGNTVTMTSVTVTGGQSSSTSGRSTSGSTSGGSSSSNNSSSGGKTGSGGSTGSSGSSGGSTGGGSSGGSGSTNRIYPSPLLDESKRKQLLPLLLDKCTTRNDAEIPARINVLTAPKAVLTCLPGLDEADVQTIMSARPASNSPELSDPIFQTPAWLVTEAKLPTSKVRALERYINSRSQTFRVQSLGYFDQGGPVARVEAVVDTNAGQPRIIYFRDLSELGRGFDIPR